MSKVFCILLLLVVSVSNVNASTENYEQELDIDDLYEPEEPETPACEMFQHVTPWDLLQCPGLLEGSGMDPETDPADGGDVEEGDAAIDDGPLFPEAIEEMLEEELLEDYYMYEDCFDADTGEYLDDLC